ncbi:hypothetical protein [Gilliamella sp. wkB112]|uniref:hypothetical protein n=1 Tax=Gilliamella sp. wkB112 TaxID=3120257 RepID=UPI00080DB943|nr:hypothetical protein [Gilliamella apicola]OCG00852.1 hypothetical protein A9G12_03560 [Gilliamella apicola]
MTPISITFTVPTSANPEKVWQYYTNMPLRKLWETDLEEFSLQGELKTGVKGLFKLQNMPPMEVTLSKVIVNQEFTEEFNIDNIGKIYFSHQIITVAPNQYALKAEIALQPDNQMDDKSCYDFIKQISDDIIDKAYLLKNLIER